MRDHDLDDRRSPRAPGLRRAWRLALAGMLVACVASRAGADDGGALPSGATTEDLDAGVEAFDASGPDASLDGSPLFDAGLEPDAGGDAAAGDAGVREAGPALADSADPGPPSAPASISEATEATGNVVRTLLGLVVLLTLAWLGGHERVRRLEERIGIAQVMTSGFPFVLLGLAARAPGIDVLSDDVVSRLTPLLQFGLGWIGFHTGFQLDSRAANEVPRGTATIVILLTALPFLCIALLVGPAMWWFGLSNDPQSLARDAIMLGLAGALSAPTIERLARTSSQHALELVRTVSVLDDAMVVIAFACLAAWLRPAPTGSDWALPAVGWVFVTFGMAAVLGLLTYAALRGTDSRAEKTSLLLGAVALTSGMAATFALPPLVVCFLAGVIFRNLPGDDKRELEDAFGRLERPIYHLFLIIVGALWRPESLLGWVVLPIFLIARTAGRYAGARVARSLPADHRPESLTETPDADLAVPPMGQLAIAFVITAETLYESAAVRAIVNAVVVGSIVLELVVQVGARRRARRGVTPTAGPQPESAHVASPPAAGGPDA